MTDDDRRTVEQVPARPRVNRWLIIALVAAIAAGVLLASSVWDSRWKSNETAAGNSVAQKDSSNPEGMCAAQASYDAIRRELFRRAAQVRGSDEQAYARLSDFALLRVNGPVARGIDDQLHSVTCSGTAVLSLPPGVAAAGGRRSLSGDLDYIVQPAADGTGNVVRLGNADAIVIPLATLARTGARANAPLAPPPVAPAPQPTAPVQQPAPLDTVQPAPAATANPSFNCGAARTRGEIAICADPGLASLDRQMAAQFNAAMSRGDSVQRGLLQRTRGRFLSYRDRCATDQCISQTYQSRMREIGDIMAGRWRG